MIMDKQKIREIVKSALKARSRQNVPIDESFCVFDMAEKLHIEVKFVDLKSLDGAYLNETHTILLSTCRPDGRIRFTCAHEIGHHIFKHGDFFDEVVENSGLGSTKKEERMCNIFASFLLMPETTVNSFFNCHGWDINFPKPREIYAASSWLGVGYSSLVNHLYYGLRKIDKKTFSRLFKIAPKKIKCTLAGMTITSNLLIVDHHWKGRPIDLQVGDYLLLENQLDNADGILASIERSKLFLYQAEKPGLTNIKISTEKGGLIVRVRRNAYVGRSIFRHLSED